MQSPFNPYIQWLGRPAPRNHYDLLGLRPFESDPEAIARAAKALATRVRGVRPGPRVAQWQQMLDELQEAQACLTDPAAKAAYDARLQSRAIGPDPTAERPPPPSGAATGAAAHLAPPWTAVDPAAPSTPSAPQAPQPEPAAAAPEDPIRSRELTSWAPPDQTGAQSIRSIARGKRRSRGPALLMWSVVGVIAVTAAVFGYRHLGKKKLETLPETDLAQDQLASGDAIAAGGGPTAVPGRGNREDEGQAADWAQPPVDEPTSQAIVPGSDASTRQEDTGPVGVDEQKAGQPESAPGRPPPAREAAAMGAHRPALVADPDTEARFRAAVSDARGSLSEHDLAGAAEHLVRAAGSVQTPEEQAELARLQTLLSHLTEFWDGIRQSVAELKGTQEIQVGDTVIVVVEARQDLLVVRAAGRNYRYPITQIPHSLVIVLARRWFADEPSSRVFLGTYLAFDPDGDRAEARRLWEQAAREGVDAAHLIPELQ